MSALYQLCYDGKLTEVRAALARGADVNSKDSFGRTALMCAVINKHNSIVKLLLDQPSVKVNEKLNSGKTALHFAAGANNPEGATLLLLHPGFNSANATDNLGDTALMVAVRNCKKDVLVELVRHDSVSLEIPEWFFDESRADLRLIIDEARTRRSQVSNLAASIQRGTSQGSNLAENNQGGASRLSTALGSTFSLNEDGSNQGGASRLSSALGSTLSLNDDDSVSECRERCRQELEELRKNQTERVQLLLQQHEEKEQKLRKESQEKEEKLKLEYEKKEQELKKENQEKEEALKAENERVLSQLLEENESQEALMLAKHDGEERAAKKSDELKAERNPSAPSQLPQIPECPVCLEELAPPTRIFQCRNGHLICETCKTELMPCICPKCRQEMIGRATDMEAFLRSLQ